MKKIILLALAILATTFSVTAQQTGAKKEKKTEKDYDDGSWSRWSGGERVKGQGPSVTETRDLRNFKGFKSSISADITLKQTSGTYKVKLEGQKNILSLLKTEVVDGILKINFAKDYSMDYREPLKITVEAPSFEFLGMSGSGNVTTENALSGEKISINISGSGNFDMEKLQYSNISVSISGSGDVTLGGSAQYANLVISGSGDLKAGNLKTQKANCRISGSGNISLNVSKELDALVSGSGDIHYSGNPPSVKTKVSGSGDISSK